MTSIENAKKQIKSWESLVKVADKLGFHISDQFPEDDYEYLATRNSLKKHLPVLLELLEQSGYHKNYLLWHLEDIDDVITFVAAIAMAQGKVLNKENDKWSLVDPDKFSARELTNKD